MFIFKSKSKIAKELFHKIEESVWEGFTGKPIWFGSDPDQSYNNLSPSVNPFKNL